MEKSELKSLLDLLEKEIGGCREINILKIISGSLNEKEVLNDFLLNIKKLKNKYPQNIQIYRIEKLLIHSIKNKEPDTQKKENLSESSFGNRKDFEKINVKALGLSKAINDTGNMIDSNYTMYQASKSHGYAAEKMNHLFDAFQGKNAKIVGDNNSKNGADRLVNSVEIQTKFCATGRRCIVECLDHRGEFKYFNSNGTPMKIEVPQDKYDEALKVLQEKIIQGKVSGIMNAEQAKEILKQSPFTYEQAKNVAKFGTIESITFDSIEGIRTAGSSMGISAALSFAFSIWNGEKVDDAIKKACITGIEVGGLSWISNIATKQLARTSLQNTMKIGTDAIVKQLGPKASALIVNSMRSSPIHGSAAMKHLSKKMGGDLVSSAFLVMASSSGDIYRMTQGKASGKQVLKTFAKESSTLGGSFVGSKTGGIVGAQIGATIGSVVPVAGSAIGATVGGIVGFIGGGIVGGACGENVADIIIGNWLDIKDDVDEMKEVFKAEFFKMTFDNMITEKEAEKILISLKEIDEKKEMRNMYSKQDKNNYARIILNPHIKRVIWSRKKIVLPREIEMVEKLEEILV